MVHQNKRPAKRSGWHFVDFRVLSHCTAAFICLVLSWLMGTSSVINRPEISGVGKGSKD